jgi:hypothetical protein
MSPQLGDLRQNGLRALTFTAASVCLVTSAVAGPATAADSSSDHASTAGQSSMAVKTLTAHLTGEKEVAPGDGNGMGMVTVRLRPVLGKVCARVTYQRIGNPDAAHIHRGRRGVDGPVRVDLSGSVTGGPNCTKAPRPLIRRILLHPRRYYFNIHTPAFPAGAVRGQLHR